MRFDISDSLNGFELTALQSSENADKVISTFKKSYMGGNPNHLLQSICDKFDFGKDDILPHDIKRIEREVETYIRRNF